MADPVVERAWTCLGCGKPWLGETVPRPFATCECGDDRWAYRVPVQTAADESTERP